MDGDESFRGFSYVHLPKEAEKKKAINDLVNQDSASYDIDHFVIEGPGCGKQRNPLLFVII